MDDREFKVNFEVISDADVPQEKVLAGPVRVQIWKGTRQHEAVETLRWLADSLRDPSEWRRRMGE
jgi:hypothetical protein